jgi:pimeloyl-ACP methyl ester carboxylesterase
MPFASTAAGDLFYARRGAGPPALICLHGAGDTHTHWGYQLRDLADQAEVFALDLPGHGRSALPGRTSIADYAAAVLAFMDANAIDRVALAGHSMGGAIALWLALEYPERISGLALVATGARLRVATAILAGFARDLPATIRTIVDLSYAPTAPGELRAKAEQAYALCDPGVYHGDFVACDGFDVLARLGELRCPAAIVAGADDRMTPAALGERLRAGIAGSRLTVVPGAGHMVLIERPLEVSAALRALLARL